MSNVQHPIAVGKRIIADRPSCPCRGAQIIKTEGVVGKVIQNNAGFWYYLTDVGVTVKGEWVKAVL